jgi:hypothetical protein
MTIQTTTAQALKSFTGAALFGLGIDVASMVSCQLTQLLQTLVQEAASVVFWAVIPSWQPSQVQVLGQTLSLAGCPVEIAQSLGSMVQTLGRLI